MARPRTVTTPPELWHPTLGAYVRSCRAAGHATATLKKRAELIDRVIRELGDPTTIKAAELVDWLAGLHLTSKWSLCTYFGTLTSFFGWMLSAGHRGDDPTASMRAPKAPQSLPKPVSEDDLKEALRRLSPQWRLVVMLAAYAGLRRGDIAAIRREDVTESEITITAGKGGRDAVIPTHPEIWALVEPMPPGPLVRKRTGGRVDANWVGSIANYMFRRIGMPHLHLHMFRHRFATILLRAKERGGAGANLRVVQTLMRHSSPATTAKYTLVTVDELRDAIGGL